MRYANPCMVEVSVQFGATSLRPKLHSHSLPILCPTDPESPHQRVVLLRPGDAGDEFFN